MQDFKMLIFDGGVDFSTLYLNMCFAYYHCDHVTT